MTQTKSAINEARDQLFLDRADGAYLTAVTNNLGLNRPVFGFSNDDLWRAVVRRLALDTKQVENVFRDLLTVIIGPQHPVSTVLSANIAIDDTEIGVASQMNIPQLGTLIIDSGLADEETFEYFFRDPRDGTVYLKTAATKAHTALTTFASSAIIEDAAISATSVKLLSTLDFPEPSGGDQVPVLLSPQTVNEEVVLMSNNNKTTGVLTVTALTRNHTGAKTTPLVTNLVAVLDSQLVLIVGDVTNFPAEGYIRLTENGGTPSEDLRYSAKNNTANQLTLLDAVVGTYSAASVTLLKTDETAQLAQVLVQGKNWDVFQTALNTFRIYIPAVLQENRLLDASFLHDSQTSPGPSTTVAVLASIGDTELEVADASSFPDSGVLIINSSEYIGYSRINRVSAKLTFKGSDYFHVDSAATISALFSKGIISQLILDYGGANQETVTIASVSTQENKITATAALANPHAVNESVESVAQDTIHLLRGLESGHAIGQTVQLSVIDYAGTDLEDGRIFTANPNRYQGPYSYSFETRLKETVQTTLDENLAGPVNLLVSQKSGRTALEVRDASLFNTDFQQVLIGRTIAGTETLNINDITTRRSVSTTVNGAATAGDTTLTVAAASGLPEAYGYRLFLDDNVTGGNNEEIIIVKSFNPGTNVVTIDGSLAKNRSVGDNVRLLADVITTDVLDRDHFGTIPYADRKKLVPEVGSGWAITACPGLNSQISTIEEIRSYIKVASSASFSSSGGYALLNASKGKIAYRSQLSADASSGAVAVTVKDGSQLPTANFVVVIGESTRIAEVLEVTSRVGNTLNLAAALLFDHLEKEDVRFLAGESQVLIFSGTATGKLLFNQGYRAGTYHAKGEIVYRSSRALSTPSIYGNDYPFYIPSSLEDRIKYVFDLARAAGVKVEIIASR